MVECTESDHMKLVIRWEEEENVEEEESKDEHIVWGEKDIEKYKEEIRGVDKEKNWCRMKERIKTQSTTLVQCFLIDICKCY